MAAVVGKCPSCGGLAKMRYFGSCEDCNMEWTIKPGQEHPLAHEWLLDQILYRGRLIEDAMAYWGLWCPLCADATENGGSCNYCYDCKPGRTAPTHFQEEDDE